MPSERLEILDSKSNVNVKDGRLEVDIGGSIEGTITAVINSVAVTNTVKVDIVDDINFSNIDQTEFTINGAITDFNVSSCIGTAWNNVTTAKELSMYANQNVKYKLNATANGNMILPKKSAVFEDHIDMTNIFVTTTQTTTCYIQLKG